MFWSLMNWLCGCNDRRVIAAIDDRLTELHAEEVRELARERDALLAERREVDQILGKALGYPPNCADVSESGEATICTGPNTIVTLAREAAGRIEAAARAESAAFWARYEDEWGHIE